MLFPNPEIVFLELEQRLVDFSRKRTVLQELLLGFKGEKRCLFSSQSLIVMRHVLESAMSRMWGRKCRNITWQG